MGTGKGFQLLYFVVLTLVRYKIAGSQTTCYQCDRVFQPAICMTTALCGEHETCYVERGLTNNGGVAYYSGCYPIQDCKTTRSNHFDSQRCLTCCRGDLCNLEGCGSLSLVSANQNICFSCTDLPDPSECRTTSVCEPGQKCGTEAKLDNGTLVYDTGCFNTTSCASPNVECCDGRGCNLNLTANYSSPVTTTVMTTTLAGVAPVIVGVTNTTVTKWAGSVLVMTCNATGTPPPDFHWIIPPNGRGTERLNGTVLLVANIQTAEGGAYVCEATNQEGTAQKVIQVTVLDPSAFTAPPQTTSTTDTVTTSVQPVSSSPSSTVTATATATATATGSASTSSGSSAGSTAAGSTAGSTEAGTTVASTSLGSSGGSTAAGSTAGSTVAGTTVIGTTVGSTVASTATGSTMAGSTVGSTEASTTKPGGSTVSTVAITNSGSTVASSTMSSTVTSSTASSSVTGSTTAGLTARSTAASTISGSTAAGSTDSSTIAGSSVTVSATSSTVAWSTPGHSGASSTLGSTLPVSSAGSTVISSTSDVSITGSTSTQPSSSDSTTSGSTAATVTSSASNPAGSTSSSSNTASSSSPSPNPASSTSPSSNPASSISSTSSPASSTSSSSNSATSVSSGSASTTSPAFSSTASTQFSSNPTTSTVPGSSNLIMSSTPVFTGSTSTSTNAGVPPPGTTTTTQATSMVSTTQQQRMSSSANPSASTTPAVTSGQPSTTTEDLSSTTTVFLDPPTIVGTNETSVTQKEGSRIVLSCNATGTPPPQLTWIPPPNGRGSVLSNGTVYVIPNIHDDEGGDYVCEATNQAGKAEKLIHVTVTAYTPVETTIKHDPWVKGAAVKGFLIVQCDAEGKPEPWITWDKIDGVSSAQIQDGVLVFSGVSLPGDLGLYVCNATNNETQDESYLAVYEEATVDCQSKFEDFNSTVVYRATCPQTCVSSTPASTPMTVKPASLICASLQADGAGQVAWLRRPPGDVIVQLTEDQDGQISVLIF